MDIPDADSDIATARHEELTVWRESQRVDLVCVIGKGAI